ncbi:aryl-sulfate sulfotransferase N-terminal domain-containing protein [Shewanella marina]|uniref:aryl-sulfate sulfotransferase N-terminal domain-containing protein n=1 Tax=Shewanella marina TaxID=487319 RepID=UPI000A47EED6|nr:aryl-sulfate sulfotransferase N-terminal domain-containing protein [Shewanella marina]
MRLSTVAIALCSTLAFSALAAGPEGLKVHSSGPLGVVEVNPFGYAPLTAVIDDAGKNIKNVTVTVQGKDNNGVDINYPVKNSTIATYGGIPVFGLYPAYANKVTVNYQLDGKALSHTYSIWTNDVDFGSSGDTQWAKAPIVKVNKVDEAFKDRLYLVNFSGPTAADAKMAHNNPSAPAH